MRTYFEAEMRLLQEQAQEFAKAYPEIARSLNLQSLSDRDPYIERLLEGVAFLTAQIQQRIDDDFPDICETLLWQLWPQMLQPFPSATIIEFIPKNNQSFRNHHVAAGTILQSQAVGDSGEKIACQFRTTSAVTLYPFCISDFTISEAKQGGRKIQIKLKSNNDSNIDTLNLNELCFFIHADINLALQLRFALTHEAKQIKILLTDPEQPSKELILENTSFNAGYLSPDDFLLPNCKRSFNGFHFLHDYFSFRHKHLFVSLNDLHKIAWPKHCQQFVIEIDSNATFPSNTVLNKEMLRLNCVPAINIFEKSSEPLYLSQHRMEYPLIADANNREATWIYNVDKVTAVNLITGFTHDYPAMPDFASQTYYHISQRFINENYPTHFLTIGGQLVTEKEYLSCAITAHNGHYPRRYLQQENMHWSNATFPIQIQNITRPTPLLMPAKRHNYRWALLSHLSLNLQAIDDPSNLKDLLTLYDWTNNENKQRIEGIKKISINPVQEISKGALIQILEFELDLQEDNYSSLADIHLFGTILHRFFSMYGPINNLIATKIICHPSNKEFSWKSLIN